jgi:hypothetical protein
MSWARTAGGIAAVVTAGLVWGASSASAGWGPPVRVGPATRADLDGPALAGGGGSLAIGWTDGAFHPRVAVRAPGRGFRSTRLRGLPFTCGRPEVAVGPGGDAAVAWQQRGPAVPLSCAVFAATAAPGKSFGPAQRVSVPGEGTGRPSLAVGRGGTTALSWTGSDFVQATVAPRGGRFGREQNASRFEYSFYSIAGVDPQNRAVVLWTTGGRDVTKLRRARRAKRGGFDAPVTIGSPAPGFHGYPFGDWTARFDAAGIPIVLFNPYADSGARELDALVGTRRQVLESGRDTGSVSQGSLAVAPNGTALAVWIVSGGGHNMLHAALRRAGGGFGRPFSVHGAEGPIDGVAAAIGSGGLGTIAWWDGAVHAVPVTHGIQIGAPRRLVADGTFPSAAVDGAGRAFVAWETNNAVQLATFREGAP